MSLITRCPACETLFRVVPDQLRISEGWVRCGQCGEIFDASQHLQADPNSALAPVEAPPENHASASAEPASADPFEAAFEKAIADPLPQSALVSEAPASPHTADPAHPTHPAHSQGLAAAPQTDPFPPVGVQHVARHLPEPFDNNAEPAAVAADKSPWATTVVPDQDIEEHAPVLSAEEPAAAPAGLATPLTSTEPQKPFAVPVAARAMDEVAPDISFMRGAKQNPAWKRPMVRVLLLVLVLLLAAVFAAQVLVHERDRIGAMQPSARPVLLALCALAQCKLSPLRQIESVAIDSSSFALVRADNYKLAFSLKNNAPTALAMPAIELSLTDTQDQPLIRRVLLPADFSAGTSVLAGGSDWNGALSLGVTSSPNLDRVAGYRLLAFYP